MAEEKYWNLMSRYLSNDLSLSETEELLAWLDEDPARADLLKELRDTWDATQNYPDDFVVDTEAGWKKLKSAIDVQEKAQVRSIGTFSWIGIAASLLLITFAGILGYQYLNASKLIKVATVSGQNKEIVLPDGSKVWLNENSSLSYADDLNESDIREVTLRGEAFFDVAKNPSKRFVIETDKTLTQVLGTSFNVLQDKEGSIKVSVITGKVSFKSQLNPNQELILLPGDAGVISKEGYAGKSRVENQNFLFWKNKQLAFNNATLSEVLKTLEMAYHVKFQTSNEKLLQHRITTSFNHVSFIEAVDVLETLLDLKIEKSDSVYVVEKKQ